MRDWGKRHGVRRALSIAVFALLMGAACDRTGSPESDPRAVSDAPLERAPDEPDEVTLVEVEVGASCGTQSVLVHAPMTQSERTFGPARDRIDVTFSRDVDIHALHASVDADPPALFELELAIDRSVYGSGAGILAHWTMSQRTEMDESIYFDPPVNLADQQVLSALAWIANNHARPFAAQPEIVVHYAIC